jgi:hypothetical protein
MIRFDSYMTAAFTNTRNDIDAVTHFKGRMAVHISKLAMVMAVSREDTLEISEIDMMKAIHYVDSALKTLEKVFRGAGDSDMAEATGRVQEYFESHGGSVTRRELLRNLYRHMTDDALDKILYVLVEIGYCKCVTTGVNKIYNKI